MGRGRPDTGVMSSESGKEKRFSAFGRKEECIQTHGQSLSQLIKKKLWSTCIKKIIFSICLVSLYQPVTVRMVS